MVRPPQIWALGDFQGGRDPRAMNGRKPIARSVVLLETNRPPNLGQNDLFSDGNAIRFAIGRAVKPQ